MHGAFEIRALVAEGMRVNLLLVKEKSRRLMFHKDFKDRAATIRAKAELGLLVRQGR